MKTTLRPLLAAALLVPMLAPAQTTPSTTVGVPPSVQVTQLGPQLVPFAGGQANFDSLVNGLALGQPVTLSTVLPNGLTQVVSFAPASTLTTTQIAQTLESARQNLISLGIAVPTSQQLAVALTGGTLPTQTGAVTVNALLPANVVPATTAAAGGTRDAAAPTTSTGVTTTVLQPNGTPSPSALMQGQSGAGGTTPPSPAAILQQQRGGNVSDTPTSANTSNTPVTGTTPGVTAPTATTGAEPRATQQQGTPLPRRETSAPASPSGIGR